MIRIVDNTLTALDNCLPSKEELHTFCQMLLTIGIDMIELSIAAYEKMEELPKEGKYILKINYLEEMKSYPKFYRYLCHYEEDMERVINDIQINDARELPMLRTFDKCSEIRIVGLDDLMCKDYNRLMKEIKNILPNSKIIFCPENTYGCASALAVQWILNEGKEITTSFAGYKNNAATEEVIMALRLTIRHKPNRDLSILPELTKLFEKITNTSVGNKKPIIGKNIFKVESGIHADGIHKNPSTYEAYAPKCVGGKSELIIGKHSGIKAIRIKLIELKIPIQKDYIAIEILNKVKIICIEKGRSLKEEEFKQLSMEVICDEREQIHSGYNIKRW